MSYLDIILDTMKTKNISATLIEKENNLSQSTISNWKRGATPSIDSLIKVIKYLGLSADELFDLKHDNTDISLSILQDKNKRLDDELIKYKNSETDNHRKINDMTSQFEMILDYSNSLAQILKGDRDDKITSALQYNNEIIVECINGINIAEKGSKYYKQ
nr:helix-turn-helix transcriptional regulator [uncultured Lachnoclostridium sp.]